MGNRILYVQELVEHPVVHVDNQDLEGILAKVDLRRYLDYLVYQACRWACAEASCAFLKVLELKLVSQRVPLERPYCRHCFPKIPEYSMA